jgi:hypothetical protein
LKIAGMMVVGAGEADRYLKTVMDRTMPLVDRMFIWGVSPDTKTEKLIESYSNVEYHRCDGYAWAEFQPQIKYTLLTRYILPYSPDWIVALDSDEIFDKRVTREVLEMMTLRGEIAFTFYCVHLYDDENHYRNDGAWGGFRNVRFWKPIYEIPQYWSAQKLHCGLAPRYAYAYAGDSEFYFKHYGYLGREDRKKKAERYKKHDPGYIYMSPKYYDTILTEPELHEFSHDLFVRELTYSPKRPNIEKITKQYMTDKNRPIVNFMNEHGIIVSTDNPLTITQWRQNKRLKELGNSFYGETQLLEELPVVNKTEENTRCDYCGFVGKNVQSLRMHKMRMHK